MGLSESVLVHTLFACNGTSTGVLVFCSFFIILFACSEPSEASSPSPYDKTGKPLNINLSLKPFSALGRLRI